MTRRIVQIFAVLLGLFALWLFIVAMHWLPPLSAEQRERLATLRDRPEPTGDNAWASLWLLDYAVPDSERAALLANPPSDLPAHLAERYPKREQARLADQLCGHAADGCLVAVAGQAEAMRAALAPQAEVDAGLEAAHRFDHLSDPREPSLSAVGSLLPYTHFLARVRARAALDFHDGRHAQAASLVCRDARWWRQVRTGTDSLVHSMVGIHALRAHGVLLAEMMAADPELALDPACDAAFSPVARAELDLCNAMRGQFREMEHWQDQFAGQDVGAWERLQLRLVNTEHMLALTSSGYGQLCRESAVDALVAGRLPEAAPDPGHCGTLAWTFDPMGCVIGSIASAAYESYPERVLDLARRQRLLASAIWLHRERPADPAAAFAARPEALRDPAARYLPAADGEGPKLAVDMVFGHPDPVFVIPAPTAMHQDESAGLDSAP